jgi:hypothetical protein
MEMREEVLPRFSQGAGAAFISGMTFVGKPEFAL